MTQPIFDILCPGNYFCDLIFTGFPAFPQLGREVYTDRLAVVPGGGAINTSVGLRRLGVNVGWVGQIGNDVFSRIIEEYVTREGLDLALVQRLDVPLQRVTVALSFPEDRAFVTYVDDSPDSIEMAWRALDVAQFRHLHFGGLMIHERIPPLLEACHVRGITVSMDCQERVQTLATPLVGHILENLDLFIPNASEALKLTQAADLEAAVRLLRARCKMLVVKNGAQGALAVCDGRRYDSPAIVLAGPVLDTTGAGDVFNAGFLAAHIEGRPITDCLQWGNFCGGMSVQGMGGTSSAPTRDQLNEYLG